MNESESQRACVRETVAYRHLYLHVPFCARRCSYCDFSISVRRDVPVQAFVTAVANELALRDASRQCDTLETLYLGGGTPSRLGEDGVVALLRTVRNAVRIASDAEVTLEANPEDITASAVRAWRDAGITRLSIGIQSFDDRVLSWMHRVHNADTARRAIGIARAQGLDAFSVDLIFAIPDALARDWQRDVDETLALDPNHVSLYGLTIEPHTPLGKWAARGDAHESPEERYEAEFLAAHASLVSAGFDHYEVSNFAKPGQRALHNSAYWTGAPYLGIGPSAHGFDGNERRWNIAAYAAWERAVDQRRDPIGGAENLSVENRIAETVYLGLRTADGLSVTHDEHALVSPWLTEGWVEWNGDRVSPRLRCTPYGWLRLDSLAASLTAIRSR